MSAFTVHRDHIDLLVTASIYGGPHNRGLRFFHDGEHHRFDRLEANLLGTILLEQNVASVCARYDGYADVDPYQYREVANVGGGENAFIPWGHVLRALSCYEYQSCETDDWNESIAKAICDALRLKVCDRIGGADAPWEWTREEADRRWETLHPKTKV